MTHAHYIHTPLTGASLEQVVLVVGPVQFLSMHVLPGVSVVANGAEIR